MLNMRRKKPICESRTATMSQSALSAAQCSMCAFSKWNRTALGSAVATGSTVTRLASTIVESSPTPASISRAKASIAGRRHWRRAELTLERVVPTGRELRSRRKVIAFRAASWASP